MAVKPPELVPMGAFGRKTTGIRNKKDIVQMLIKVPSAYRKQLRKIAFDNEMSMNGIVNGLIYDYIMKNNARLRAIKFRKERQEEE